MVLRGETGRAKTPPAVNRSRVGILGQSLSLSAGKQALPPSMALCVNLYFLYLISGPYSNFCIGCSPGEIT